MLSDKPLRIPVPMLDDSWQEFALTFNAYERVGVEKLGDFANAALHHFQATGQVPDSVDDLRACLFYEQRRWRHFGQDPLQDPETKSYLQALLRALHAVTGGSLPGPGDRLV